MKREEILKIYGQNDVKSGNPSVYVGTWSKYNSGSLYGAWLDLTTFNDYDEFINVCKQLHGEEVDPEFDFQDFDNVPESKQNYSGIKEIINLCNEEEDDTIDMVLEFWDEVSNSTVEEIKGSHVFTGNFADFAAEQANEMMGNLFDTLRHYFDYESFERDLSMDYIISSNYVFTA